MSDFDPTTLATQLAGYDILALQTSLKSQTSTLEAQKKLFPRCVPPCRISVRQSPG